MDYSDDRGKQQPLYRLTRDDVTLLTMGFTGKEAGHRPGYGAAGYGVAGYGAAGPGRFPPWLGMAGWRVSGAGGKAGWRNSRGSAWRTS
ncbi:MAG: hypothetical protein HQL59_04685 [Magnetococcales bacterium]|nr:hypothetical protein [Magnetococcales bacterium]